MILSQRLAKSLFPNLFHDSSRMKWQVSVWALSGCFPKIGLVGLLSAWVRLLRRGLFGGLFLSNSLFFLGMVCCEWWGIGSRARRNDNVYWDFIVNCDVSSWVLEMGDVYDCIFFSLHVSRLLVKHYRLIEHYHGQLYQGQQWAHSEIEIISMDISDITPSDSAYLLRSRNHEIIS